MGKPALSLQRKLAKALTIEDLRAMGRRATPRAAFDYVDGAAENEISLARARQAFEDVEFSPTVLGTVEDVDLSAEVFGQAYNMPLGIAPTGFTRMMHSHGEYAGVTAAGRAGIPFTLSTMGTVDPETLAETAPDSSRWFQLYVWKDRVASETLIQRAADSGMDTLMLTVDTPVAGHRMRDIRHGMTIPPQLSVRTLADFARKPRWWFNQLTHEPVEFASMRGFAGTPSDIMAMMFDPTLAFKDLTWLREIWDGNLVVKGIQSVEDAKRVVDAGADGIVVSNHGGRQLDRAPIPLYLLPDVRKALGPQATILLDTGVMNGADLVAARALGADMALIGRAYLYGLMAGGLAGVERALEILGSQALRTMQLLGVTKLQDLSSEHVTLLERLTPRQLDR